MADPKGFLKYTREMPEYRPVKDRIRDYDEIYAPFPKEKIPQQAARCMDCGVPFCHNGCPLGNIIPEFNDAVYREDWAEAFDILSSTNNFPEFTGRICPAPCEAACVLGINEPAVTIEHIEKNIAETAWKKGYIQPRLPKSRTGKKIAIIGSGPAGLAAADQLNQCGHWVTVFERNDQIGGLLRYGIPDFKLDKKVLDRRLDLLRAEGIQFKTGANVGQNVAVSDLLDGFDALVLCGGSTISRDLNIPGRHLRGVHFAMTFLEQQNRRVAGRPVREEPVLATGKNVVVIGGGDTGADCVGTANRQQAQSVTQLEIMPMPPTQRPELSWPQWPVILRTSSSHEEGCQREWAVLTKAFLGDESGHLRALQVVDLAWDKDPDSGQYAFREKAETTREIPCDLALIAAGFVHPQKEGLLAQLGVELDTRGNVKTREYQTSVPGVFAAGDMRRGQSLVVWAIAEGRKAAAAVHAFVGRH